MKIAVYGMGYVGLVSAACLVRDGHSVVGVELRQEKVEALKLGNTPIQEPGIQELIQEGVRTGKLTATTDHEEGIKDADMVWICVGTPSTKEHGIDLSAVQSVMKQIGEAMKETGSKPLIVLRSTVLPGTMNDLVTPTLEKSSGYVAGEDFHAVFHPEFLREGSAIADFDVPSRIVIGEAKKGAGDSLMGIYEKYDAPKFSMNWEEAELLKFCDNAFHALKISFANEVGSIARASNIDSRKVMEVFCSDVKLNISPRYLRPGFAYGGSCLPKDLRSLIRHATLHGINTPLLSGIPESNEQIIQDTVQRILSKEPRSVGFVGLAFKPNTDDMRESPFVTVAKSLIGEGMEIKIYDPNVYLENLIGANKIAVESALKHLASYLVQTPEELSSCELIIINHPTVQADLVEKWLGDGKQVFDLVGLKEISPEIEGYEGIAW